MEKPCQVVVPRFAEKQLSQVPVHIKEALGAWADKVEKWGLRSVRRIAGYHDEPLKGSRVGQRSIRLNRAYRAIYEEDLEGDVILVAVMEVNKHDYR